MTRRLFVNLGNTALHWAREEDGQWQSSGRLGWGEGGMPAEAWATVAPAEGPGQPDDIIACVSSPRRLAAFEAATALPVRVLGRDFSGGIAVAYHQPERLGPDRLAAATAAANLYGTPCIVVTAGTCLTCKAVSAAGVLVGGAIAPGLPVYLKGLAAAVPHLPDFPLSCEGGAREPGRTPEENLTLGTCLSLAAAADRLAAAMREAVGDDAALVLSGGDAERVQRLSLLQWQVSPLLAIEGLRIIHDGS